MPDRATGNAVSHALYDWTEHHINGCLAASRLSLIFPAARGISIN